MLKYLLSVISIFVVKIALAAPIPATSTSSLIQTDKQLFRSPLGFSIHADKTDWLLAEPEQDNRYITTLYRSPNSFKGVQAALSIRVDGLSQEMSLMRYVRQWLKDYPRFGFDVLTSQKINIAQNQGYLLDLVSYETQKQLRQVIFVKGKNAVILTCRDHKDNFQASVKNCNQIIKNFIW